MLSEEFDERKELTLLGVSTEEIEQLLGAAKKEREVPAICESNITAVALFSAVGTQWRTAPMGGVIGLDYNAVDVVIERLAFRVEPEDWRALQIMERHAVQILTSRSKS